MTKLFNANVKDSLGWKYDNAWVGVYDIYANTGDAYQSKGPKEPFKKTHEITSISYRANFWQNRADQEAELTSRPLINENPQPIIDDDGDVSHDDKILCVDLEHLQSVQVTNSALSPEEKHFRLIELDVNRRSAS